MARRDPLAAKAKQQQASDPLLVGGPQEFDKPIDQPEGGPATADAQPPVRVAVSVNTLITRVDLGPNCKTFVAAGDLIPTGLESLPRGPA